MSRSNIDRRVRNHPARPTAGLFEPLESRQMLSASGLTLNETKSTLPTAQLAGATVKGAVTVEVTNSLPTPIKGPQTFNVYASLTSDGAIDTSSLILGHVTRGNLALGTGKSTKITIPVNTAAPGANDYDIFIQAIDGAGNTSTAGMAPPVSVAAPNVALTAVVGAPKPSVALINHTVTFKVTFTNTGNIDSAGALDAAIEEESAATTTPTTGATILGTPQDHSVKIGRGGKAVTLTYHAKLTTVGNFFLGGAFTQGTQTFSAFSTTEIMVGGNT